MTKWARKQAWQQSCTSPHRHVKATAACRQQQCWWFTGKALTEQKGGLTPHCCMMYTQSSPVDTLNIVRAALPAHRPQNIAAKASHVCWQHACMLQHDFEKQRVLKQYLMLPHEYDRKGCSEEDSRCWSFMMPSRPFGKAHANWCTWTFASASVYQNLRNWHGW